MGFGGSSGGGGSIAGSSDAALNNPANNQVLTYDSAAAKWKNAAPAAGSEWATLLAAIPTDGTTNASPAIQALYDAGYPFYGKITAKYFLGAPLFLDQPRGNDGLYSQSAWEPQGRFIIDSPNMPTVQVVSDESAGTISSTGIKGAIFDGVKREAWNQGAGTILLAYNKNGVTTPAVASTKSFWRGSNQNNNDGTPHGFQLRNVTFEAISSSTSADNNLIVIWSMVRGSDFQGITLRSFRALHTWLGYTDLQSYRHCHVESGAGQYYPMNLIEQRDYGDGITIESVKTNGHGIGNFSYARGLTIDGLVTSDLTFDSCESVSIRGAHEEANIGDVTQWTIKKSQVTIETSNVYVPDGVAGTTPPSSIVIDDTNSSGPGDGASTVVFKDVSMVRRIQTDQETYGTMVHISVATQNTTVIFDNVMMFEVTNQSSGYQRRTPGKLISATNATLQAALDTVAAQAIMATGSFKFSRINGTWKVTPLHTPSQIYWAPQMNAITTIVAAGGVTGTLSGGPYYYAFAIENAPGRHTQAGTGNANPSGGSIRLRLEGIMPGALHIWRSDSNALSAPTHYVRMPSGSYNRAHFWDVGPVVAGATWETYQAGTYPAPFTSSTSQTIQYVEGTEITL